MTVDPDTKTLEALKLINDWSKWLITLEMAAIAIIGGYFTATDVVGVPPVAKAFGICAVLCFVFSITAAAMLLWSLPEITQTYQPGINVWMTEDGVARKIFRMNTQGFAVLETVSFILGMLFFTALILVTIWLK